MSRYTGPRVRVMRALGTWLPGLSPKTPDNRPYPPGQHGGEQRLRRKAPSDYKKQLQEKQKVRYHYGVNETQLRNLLLRARRTPGASGDNLIILLERRLDNICFRAGFAPTIPAARQLVVHGHVLVNGKRLSKPAAQIRVGDVVTIKEKAKAIPAFQKAWAAPTVQRPDWLTIENEPAAATLREIPPANAVPFELNTQLVIEWYTRRL